MNGIDWQQVITSVGGQTAFLAVAAWLLKVVITDRLKANSDEEIEHVKNDLALEAKSFELKLKASADADIERLKNSLQIATLEHQIRFSRLHERRAEVIAELYKLSFDLEREGKRFTYNAGHDPKMTEQGLPTVIAAFQNFNTFVEDHRIYLPEPVCQSLDGYIKLLEAPLFHTWKYGDKDFTNPAVSQQQYEGFEKAFKAFETDIPVARQALMREFRDILGGSNVRN